MSETTDAERPAGPVRPARTRAARTARRRRAVQAAVLCCVLGLLPATWLRLSTDDVRPRAGVSGAPSAPVALVFGAGLWDGEPSPYLAHRLDAAADLYERGKVRAVLVSGDNSREEYDEPEAMRAYLRAVPQLPAGARRQLQHLAALSERPNTTRMRTHLRLAMHRI